MAVRSALRSGCTLPPRKILGTHFCWQLSQLQGHRSAGRIRSIEKCNDSIDNRTCELPACSVMPQLTMLPRALSRQVSYQIILLASYKKTNMSLANVRKDRPKWEIWCEGGAVGRTVFSKAGLVIELYTPLWAHVQFTQYLAHKSHQTNTDSTSIAYQ
jgi:hypothetical protein